VGFGKSFGNWGWYGLGDTAAKLAVIASIDRTYVFVNLVLRRDALNSNPFFGKTNGFLLPAAVTNVLRFGDIQKNIFGFNIFGDDITTRMSATASVLIDSDGVGLLIVVLCAFLL
jgi:hypothetical protein